MSASVRLSAPVVKVLIIDEVKSCLVVMTDMLEASAEDCVLMIFIASSRLADALIIAEAPSVESVLAQSVRGTEDETFVDAVVAAVLAVTPTAAEP